MGKQDTGKIPVLQGESLMRTLLKSALALGMAMGLAGIAHGQAKTDAPSAKLEDMPKNAEGFYTIFNGKDLTGWEGFAQYWTVKDGAISGHETKDKSRQTFLIFTGAKVSDFELHLKFKFAAVDGKVDGNSGIQFRSKIMDPLKDPYRAGGYQADFDAGNGYTGIIYDEAGGAGGRGVMSNRGEKTHWDADNQRHNEKLDKSSDELKKMIKVGDWNDVVLTAKGNHIVYQINGNVTTDLTDDSPKAVKEGILAIQVHQGFSMDILIKDVMLKPLAEK
jgi:hypothetical protein